MEATYICPSVTLGINGINFKVNLVVLKELWVNVILGRGLLASCKAQIKHDQGVVVLTTSFGEIIEYEGLKPNKVRLDDPLDYVAQFSDS
ncbi:hypothetical protein, partial [Pseudomonas sp. FSL R10-2189]|uniref:hypothetical protein n=1 Tax=Pseudomonas sp. FSL R10-2189 TaxID=2662199 RepID=UPI0021140D59